jgi:uncharacterized protein (TIGR00725 family)
MKKKIGVMGASGKIDEDTKRKAFEIGKEIAKHGCILVNGATTGLPREAVKGAKEEGGFVIGVSPAINKEEHEKIYALPTEDHDVIIYDGSGLKGRNVTNIRACDGVIFVSGGTGTLNEFTIAFDEEKPIGILEGTGGMTSLVKDIIRICNPLSRKQKNTKVFYDSDPKKLVEKVLEAIK